MIDEEVVARWMRESESTVVFTGAGISTESGIPDFRSPGGVWAKYQPVYFDQFMSSAAARREYWRQKSEAHREFAHARPNRGHEVLAKWENSGRLRGIVTQNIDGLHQLAGNRNVLELHGTAREIACLDCGHREPADPLVAEFLETDRVPECRDCGGRLKHATVSFGQMLPTDVLDEAERWMREAGVVLAIGSSLVVTPAADLPRVAVGSGARLVIINRDPTPLDGLADLVVNDAIGQTLAAIDDALR